ncbi:MAG: zf-HC2 domain-containing protein [Acidobacteria bacterium]|nr:zf-HC2 domain-containing protein [Acidobacteriota bacterium]
MTMSHNFEHQIAQAADDALAPELRRELDAHLATCDACRALLADQRDARALLMARPIVPVRDLSAAIRATLEAEQPWIDRLNINWRMWSLRVAPVATALAIVAVVLVRSGDVATTTPTTDPTVASTTSDSTDSVASALWTGEVSEDTLFNLFLRARPDDALENYVQAPAAGAKEQ